MWIGELSDLVSHKCFSFAAFMRPGDNSCRGITGGLSHCVEGDRRPVLAEQPVSRRLLRKSVPNRLMTCGAERAHTPSSRFCPTESRGYVTLLK
jgi:hypothetical protein